MTVATFIPSGPSSVGRGTGGVTGLSKPVSRHTAGDRAAGSGPHPAALPVVGNSESHSLPEISLQRFFAVSVLDFQKTPLIPVIAQDFETKDVLMLAYMNEEAYHETLKTGRVCYFSR